jgi:hypothetical protein
MRLKKDRKADTAYKVVGMYHCPWCGLVVTVGYSWTCQGCGRSGTKYDS